MTRNGAVIPWMWDLYTANDMSTSATLDALVDGFDERDEAHRRMVARAGYVGLLASMAKQASVLVDNGTTDQMPLFAAVFENGEWTRIAYHLQNFDQLRAFREREVSNLLASTKKVHRLDIDIELYERHPELPHLQAVWDAEGVQYRIAAPDEEAIA